MSQHSSLKGILYMLAAMLVFSCVNAVAKEIFTQYSMFQLLFFRNFFALIPMGILMMREGGFKIMKTDQLPRYIGLGVLGMIALSGLFESLARMPLAEAVSIHFSETFILTALSAWILKEKVGVQSWIAVMVGFLGVLIIFRPSLEIINMGAVFGLIFALGDSIYMINARILTRRYSSVAVVIYFAIVVSILSACFLPWYWITPSGDHLVRLILLGLGGGTGLYFVTQAYHHAPASTVAPMIYSALIWNMILGYVFWGDTPDMIFFIGAGLIVGSGLYIIYQERRRHIEITAVAPTAVPTEE